MHGSILIVDDEVEVGASLTKIFQSEGLPCQAAASAGQAYEILARNPDIALIFLDVRMPEMGGISFLKKVKAEFPHCVVVMISGYPSLPDTVQAMKFGAANFFAKPLNVGQLVTEARKLLASATQEATQGQRLISQDPAIIKLKKQIATAAPTTATVIITGESGTGKELVAEQLHLQSNRRDKPFIKINCAAIPEPLLESELFGHEKGAFTDAKSRRLGKFERASGGTVFLDEIGDMSLNTQAKILRAIQEQEVEPIGGDRVVKIDIPIISATHRNLEEMIAAGTFREDLFYRLSVVGFHLPPLRERPGDVELLIQHFIDIFAVQQGKTIKGASPEVLDRLRRHSWPGNIRELRNCIQRAVIFAENDVLELDNLPGQYAHLPDIGNANAYPDHYQAALETLEKDRIIQALEKSSGVKWKAADELHIHRKTLYNRMKKFGIDR